MAETARQVDDERRALYAKIQIAKKQLGLDDPTYRSLLVTRYGKQSSTQLNRGQLIDLVEHFKRQGFKPAAPRGRTVTSKSPGGRRWKPMAGDPQAKKIRALWLTLWHLGVVTDPSEEALASFAKRVTGGKVRGIQALQWLKGEPASKVIEALKDWAARPLAKGGGGVDWSPIPVYMDLSAEAGGGSRTAAVDVPRQRVLEAQWRILYELAWTPIQTHDALSRYADKFLNTSAAGAWHYAEAPDLDRLIEHFGRIIRERKGAAG